MRARKTKRWTTIHNCSWLTVTPGAGGLTRLRGRASECTALDRVITDVCQGQSRAQVIRGEAGVGKTAVLEYLIEAASSLQVLRAVGAESEMELAFAGLHQLCAPLLDQIDRLPEPQREALEIVFGLSGGAPPDRLLVGLAVLSLLSEASEEHPLLCVVDDAQWLDQASARTLAFVARWLLARAGRTGVRADGRPARRADRALAAAQANLQAGAFDAALDLLAAAGSQALDEFQRARVDPLRGQIAFASGLGADAAPMLLKAAKGLAPLDLELARETYLSAWAAAAFAGREGGGALPEVCRAARALPPVTQPERPLDLLLDGLALLITDGRAAAAPTLRQAASLFASEHVPVQDGLHWGWLATAASFAMWDNDGARAVCERQIQLVRNTGALEGLPR